MEESLPKRRKSRNIKNPTEENENEPSTNQVFTNSLIWRKLGYLMNFQDLQSLRLVCRGFNENVLAETTFNKRAILTITKERIAKGRLGRRGIGENTVAWRNVKIEPMPRKNDEVVERNPDWIYELLEDAEMLEIKSPKLRYQRNEEDFPSIIQILEATNPETLRSLHIDLTLLNRKQGLFNHFSDKIKALFNGLTEFNIKTSGDAVRYFSTHRGSLSTTRPVLQSIASELKNLQAMTISKFLYHDANIYLLDSSMSLKISKILPLAVTSRKQIRKLHLSDAFIFDNKPIASLIFPALQSLQLSASSHSIQSLESFLKLQNLESLEELDLFLTHEIPNSLMIIIQEKCKNLKQLKLSSNGGFDDKLNAQTWNFLSDLNNLEEFELDIKSCPTESRMHNRLALSNLPNTIKKLSIPAKFLVPSPIGDQYETLTSADFNSLNPQILTKLHLNECGYNVNDAFLEYIFKNFTKLQDFEITDNVSITDYGFTGINDTMKLDGVAPESEFSIKNLKGLKNLVIRSVVHVTDETCKEISFLELNSLDLSGNPNMTNTGLELVIKNNRSLNMLTTSKIERFPNIISLRKMNPRLIKRTASHGADPNRRRVNDTAPPSRGINRWRSYPMGPFFRFYDEDEDDYDDDDDGDGDYFDEYDSDERGDECVIM